MDYSQQPSLSVIISTNGSKTLCECLKSYQAALPAGESEIILCVSPRSDLPDGPELRGRIPVRVYRLEERGIGNIRNAGLAAAKGKTFLLLDDDCVIPSEKLVQEVMKRAQVEDHLHGGSYSIAKRSSYFARVYNAINHLWLDWGHVEEHSTVHLLGGFLFGSENILPHVRFRPDLNWGGEEKELLLRLKKEKSITGKFHRDLSVIHLDRSGFKKFQKRAFRQGLAAGHHRLIGQTPFSKLSIPLSLMPGLFLFYSLSRAGVLAGKYRRLMGTAKRP